MRTWLYTEAYRLGTTGQDPGLNAIHPAYAFKAVGSRVSELMPSSQTMRGSQAFSNNLPDEQKPRVTEITVKCPPYWRNNLKRIDFFYSFLYSYINVLILIGKLARYCAYMKFYIPKTKIYRCMTYWNELRPFQLYVSNVFPIDI